MYLTKTNKTLPTTISTITTTHLPPRIHTLLSSILHPTLTTSKYEMDLLSKDVTPPILPVLENDTLFQDPHSLRTPSEQPRDTNLSKPLKAEILARQFEQSHHLTLNMGSNTHSLTVMRHVNRFFRSISLQTPLLKLTNHYAVRRKILSLKPCAAPGDNGITSIMLRHLSLKALIYLTRLFNHLLRRGHSPNAWKRVKVISVLNPNKPPTDPNSYRTISLLSIVGKLFERIIASHL